MVIDRRDWATTTERENFRLWLKKKRYSVVMLAALLGKEDQYQTISKKISGHGAHITKTEIRAWKQQIISGKFGKADQR